ncbi:type I restriction enzyme S subunit [Dysgonomonas sp. PH5-37]|uniref:restriction endonuclease subunit S n=1 Tax=Dysgonomonas sp. PH5-37 TaxID=2940648 RepID=UPI002475ECCB|nr:restriction endonuclease subunit S [Dysgonomonas sp. PH5-37]MDH6388806.1 type I restriction enzyme S subunit [Dysgonomonas sp. PH5-37]
MPNILNFPNLRFPEFEGEWRWYKLGDIANKVNSGKTPLGGEAVYTKEGVLFIRSQNVNNDKLDLDNSVFIPEIINRQMENSVVQPNDILLNITGASLGRSCVVPNNFESGNVNQHVCIIRLNKQYNPRFVQPLFSSNKGQAILTNLQTGSGREGLTFESLKSIKISIPVLEEQQKIASFLSLIDERIITQNKIIEEFKLLKSTLSKRLLLNESWEQFQIADIASLGRGRVISSVEISKQRNPKYPLYSSQTSNHGIMGYLDTYDFDGEYVTWTTDGANAGTVFYRNGKFNCTNVCGTLKISSNHNPYFVALCLNLIAKKYVFVNLANPKLMNNVMASIKIHLPEIKEQNRLVKLFVSIVNKIQCEVSILEALREKKNYFLQQMFI